MRNLFLLVAFTVLVTVVIALGTAPQSTSTGITDAVPTATVAPTAIIAQTATLAPDLTPQVVTTFWVATASNCGLPRELWNQELYSVEKPQFTAGSTFTLEMPEFWITEDQWNWVEPPRAVAFKKPPMTTGGQEVYCNFRTWQETRQLDLP